MDTSLLRFCEFSERAPGQLAVIDPSGRRWSRAEVSTAANRLSRGLRRNGARPGDVMAILSPNSAEYVFAYLAATQIGMYVVPLNWHLAPAEIAYVLENCRARVLAVHGRLVKVWESAQGLMHCAPELQISLTGGAAGLAGCDEFAEGLSGERLADPVQGRVLSYTSATTGKPKGVLLRLDLAERALDLSIKARIGAGTLPEEHVQLCASPLYHGAPLENVIVGLHMGHSIVLVDDPEPEVVLRSINAHEVTLAYMAPPVFGRLLLLDEEIRRKYPIPSLRRVLHAGSPCPMDVKRRMIDWLGPIIWEAYGATEGSGTVVSSQDWLRYPGTVGRPMKGTRLLVVDDSGAELPAGSIGTVYLTRYSGERFEYLGDAEKTRHCYRGEFFTVGDVGYVNDEGFLFLVDRKIDMINVGGSKVYPAEIERVLANHPEVADCAVLGVPDDRHGEAILAAIQPAPAAAPPIALKRSLIRLVMQHLSLAKLPRHFVFVESIPRDANGKKQNRQLRQVAAEALSGGEP